MHLTLCIVLYALCSMHCILCIALYAIDSMHCIIRTVFYTFESLHCSMYCILCNVFYALYATVFYVLFYIYCIICIIVYTKYSINFLLCIVFYSMSILFPKFQNLQSHLQTFPPTHQKSYPKFGTLGQIGKIPFNAPLLVESLPFGWKRGVF
jgi:hypothetical protein